MNTVLIAVRDQKATEFTQPVTAPTRGAAIRSWGDQLNDPKNRDTDARRHPEDFSLWFLGEYDSNTGVITPAPVPQQLALASDLITN